MNLAKNWILLVTGGTGALAIGLTLGGANRGEPSISVEAPPVTSNADVSSDAQPADVRLLRSDDLQDVNVPNQLKGFETLVGSPERGLVVLTERLSCLDCHSIVPGEETGHPKLSDVGRRLSPKQIVTSILEPSREIADGYKSVSLVTIEGRVIRGVELDSNDQVVVVRTSEGDETIRRDQIDDMTSAKSDMPAGQADELLPQEFADLIAYLTSLGQADELVTQE